MGSAITNVHKEIYKVSRHYLTDRVMAVRCAAAKVPLPFILRRSNSFTRPDIIIIHFLLVVFIGDAESRTIFVHDRN